MKNAIYLILALVLASTLNTASLPTQDEERYFDKEVHKIYISRVHLKKKTIL